MILKVHGPISDQVLTRDHFQIWVKLKGPKTYFSHFTQTLKLTSSLYHFVSKSDFCE